MKYSGIAIGLLLILSFVAVVEARLPNTLDLGCKKPHDCRWSQDGYKSFYKPS